MGYKIKSRSLITPVLAGVGGWFFSKSIPVGVAIFALFIMPATVSVYAPYAQDNPEDFWFKRKLYGWGWTPVTWQGWFVTFVYVALVLAFALTINAASPAREVVLTFVLPVALLTITFLRIAYKKGESPKWQWGSGEDEAE